MSESTIRCVHCGLPHAARVAVCPTTGLKIDKHARPGRGRRHAAKEPPASDDIGRVIDEKYEVVGRLGSGGMSTVFEARPLAGGTATVAIKLLHASLSDDREAIARLRREADLVRSIAHPNICAVLELGHGEGSAPYLVMERLYGESLAERLRRGPLSLGELVPIMTQILAALAAAHAVGVLHRDLKPENIFIEDRGFGEPIRAKLLDFGVAKSMGYDVDQQRLTDTGMVMGTPYYMAPEQARGELRLDQRVDLWAIGVILYEALSGRRPFVASNYNALLVKILTGRPKPLEELVPGLAPPVARIVDKAIAKLREDRFQSADELSVALEGALRDHAEDELSAPTRKLRVKRPPSDTRREGAASHYRRRTVADTEVTKVDEWDGDGGDTEIIEKR